MAKLRLGTSYWLDRFTGAEPRFPRLRGRQRADIAIIGGGITGCISAYLFARAGVRVVLIDAARIARGSTAASTALLMQEPDVNFRDLAARYGTPTAARVWRRSGGAVKGLTGLLRALHVRAGLTAAPSIYWTGDAAAAARLRHELARRHAAGIGGRWLSPAALKRATGIDGAGAIVTTGNAQADPYRATVGIARAAERAGARLFEQSRALRISGGGTGVDVELDGGHVHADWAVIATGYATPEFKPLAARFRMMNTYVIATPPVAPATRRAMGLGNVMLWDAEDPYHYARWAPDGRLIFGGEDRPRLSSAARPAALQARARTLASHLAALFPVLEGVTSDFAWEGLFASTPDGLPYIGRHRRYPKQLFALGYGGNGMTFGYLAAQILVRDSMGRARDDDKIFGFGRTRRSS